MPRAPRQRSEADIYHVYMRGEGRRLIFEDDEDRRCYLRMLSSALDKYGASCLAWCLMSNHVHLLVKCAFDKLPRFAQSLMGGYAGYFNKRHEHVGHVFGGRYGSVAVNDDQYLMTVVGYIHGNPVKDGLCATCAYPWSSYNDYLQGSGFVERDFVLDVFGGIDQFKHFHEGLARNRAVGDACADANVSWIERHRLDEGQASDVAAHVLESLGLGSVSALGSLPKEKRDAGIAALRRAGLSVRQIERLTGIGRGAVSKVQWR